MRDHAEVLLVEREQWPTPSGNGARTRSTSRRTHVGRVHAEVRGTDDARHPADTGGIAEDLKQSEQA